MPTTLPSRLRRIAREMRWSPVAARLAQESGATRATVNRWLRDGEIRIDPQYGFRLADASGFSARWIMLGEGEPHPESVDLTQLPSDMRPEVVRLIHLLTAIVDMAKNGGTR